jgi:SAM-dependent methyltransferase
MSPDRSAGAGLAGVYGGIERYYSRRIAAYGATPAGVDWACARSQERRFEQLLGLCDFSAPFSLNDIGCGYGALWHHLAARHRNAIIDYCGNDLSAAMIAAARRLCAHRPRRRFVVAQSSPRIADYSVASGIFNVKLRTPVARWERFIAATLSDMHATSRRGFGVNFRAREKGSAERPELYHTDAATWSRFCKEQFRAAVEVREDYELREFTLLVRT